MRYLIMTNGDYGDLGWYRDKSGFFERIICADGAASVARCLGIVPDCLVGDMDSIREEDYNWLKEKKVEFRLYSPEKDMTDTQIAFELACQQGAEEITVWGGTGSRLDHTLSNIFSASRFVVEGISVTFVSPDLMIYLVADWLELPCQVGETVSLIVLGDEASGVTLRGFSYPLTRGRLDGRWQYAVSNVVAGPKPVISVESGILAVFHYKKLPETVR